MFGLDAKMIYVGLFVTELIFLQWKDQFRMIGFKMQIKGFGQMNIRGRTAQKTYSGLTLFKKAVTRDVPASQILSLVYIQFDQISFHYKLSNVLIMERKISKFWPISVILVLIFLSSVYCQQPICEGENPPVQCLLFKEYSSMNDELACQLCAVAIETVKYQQKTNLYCNKDQNNVRDCGLTSFAYLLTQGRFSEAFDLEYEIFYRDPFNHDEKVSAILKKQNIREKIIGWLQIYSQATDKAALINKAIANLYLDDMNESEQKLEIFLSEGNQTLDKRTLKLKCRILQKQGQFNEAYNIVSKYIKQAQKDQRNYEKMLYPYLYHLNGNLLMHHLKFDKAIPEFRKASNMFKAAYQEVAFIRGFRLSNYNIGLCFQKLSKFDQAVKTYIDLIKYVQKNAQILNALGNSYVQWAQQSQKLDDDKMRKGIFYLTQAINMNPEYYLAHYNLGFAYLKNNQLDKAVQKFQQSLTIHKTFQAQYGLLAAYFLSNNLDAAQSLISSMTINSQSIEDLLSVYYQNKGSSNTKNFYKKVITKYEDLIKSANGHYWKGMIEFDSENYGLAIAHFLQAYDKGYSEPHLLFNLAYCYQLIGQMQPAIDFYEKAYKKDHRKETMEKIQDCKQRIKQKKQKQEL